MPSSVSHSKTSAAKTSLDDDDDDGDDDDDDGARFNRRLSRSITRRRPQRLSRVVARFVSEVLPSCPRPFRLISISSPTALSDSTDYFFFARARVCVCEMAGLTPTLAIVFFG